MPPAAAGLVVEVFPRMQVQLRSPWVFAAAIAIAVAGLTHPAAAATSSAGAISLTFGPSTRGEAMGGLYLAEANDYAARWSNPGGLAFVEQPVVGTMFTQLVPGLASDVYYFFGGWVLPTKSIGTLQFDMTYLSYGQSEATADDNTSLGTFSSYELSPSVSLGFKFLPNLGLGVSAKYVRIDLAPASVLPDFAGSGSGTGTTWAFDLGSQYRANKFRLGTVLSNLGPNIAFIDDQQSDPLPTTLRVGGMYDIFSDDVSQLRAGYEFEQALPSLEVIGKPVHHVGAEFVYSNTFALRAGWVVDKDGAIEGLAGGFGVTFRNATFEYATVPQAAELDRPNRFALWLRY